MTTLGFLLPGIITLADYTHRNQAISSWSPTAMGLRGREIWNPADGFCPACLDAEDGMALLTYDASCVDSVNLSLSGLSSSHFQVSKGRHLFR